jgi:hypothetical protein
VIWTRPGDWWRHGTADVALLPISPDNRVFDWKLLPVASFATSQLLAERNFGPGEELLIMGLLVHHPGVTRIMPITRIGNIAAFPSDPIAVNTGAHVADDVVALAEVRSIGGLSGCPVFVHPGDLRTESGGIEIGVSGMVGGPNYLLGLLHGFFVLDDNDPDEVIPRADEEVLNTGISIVILADRILELLNDPRARKMREDVADAYRRQTMPRPAASRQDEQTEYDRFEDLARKLVNTPKPERDEDGGE